MLAAPSLVFRGKATQRAKGLGKKELQGEPKRCLEAAPRAENNPEIC